MKLKYLAMTGGGALLGAALVMSIGIRAEEGPTVDAPETWQVAANTTNSKQPAISMEEVIRRMEEKYNGTVTEIELDREWSGDVYEVEIRTGDGYEWDVEVDAETSEILEEKRERDD
ncbi:MAG: PepSY domain-containing protein [Gammaproteobacteria bacterium]|nr:PepSY domain-containing protein [Gammaproteobacteria bacterium]